MCSRCPKPHSARSVLRPGATCDRTASQLTAGVAFAGVMGVHADTVGGSVFWEWVRLSSLNIFRRRQIRSFQRGVGTKRMPQVAAFPRRLSDVSTRCTVTIERVGFRSTFRRQLPGCREGSLGEFHSWGTPLKKSTFFEFGLLYLFGNSGVEKTVSGGKK